MFKKRIKNEEQQLKRSQIDRQEDQNSENDDKLDNDLINEEGKKIPFLKNKRQKTLNAASTLEIRKQNQKLLEDEILNADRVIPDNFKSKFSSADVDIQPTTLEKAIDHQKVSNDLISGKLDPKIYRGEKNYATYIQQNEEQLKKKIYMGTLGPLNQQNYVKVTTRMDHNPELCKPYFETGHCPFGDTCIFIHDRTDYKSGHQLELEYMQELKRRQKKLLKGEKADDNEGFSDEDAYEIKSNDDEGNQNEDLDSNGFPFNCKICNDDFCDPVKISCGHYFCENCALNQHRKQKYCCICQKQTDGNFTSAKELIQIIEKRNLLLQQPDNELNIDEIKEIEERKEGEQQMKIMEEFKKNKNLQNKKKYTTLSGWLIP